RPRAPVSAASNPAPASLPAVSSSAGLPPSDKPANLLNTHSSASSAMAVNPIANVSQSDSATANLDIPIEEPVKRPGLGEVHLAAPKFSSSASKSSATTDLDAPGLASNGISGSHVSGLGALAA